MRRREIFNIPEDARRRRGYYFRSATYCLREARCYSHRYAHAPTRRDHPCASSRVSHFLVTPRPSCAGCPAAIRGCTRRAPTKLERVAGRSPGGVSRVWVGARARAAASRWRRRTPPARGAAASRRARRARSRSAPYRRSVATRRASAGVGAPCVSSSPCFRQHATCSAVGQRLRRVRFRHARRDGADAHVHVRASVREDAPRHIHVPVADRLVQRGDAVVVARVGVGAAAQQVVRRARGRASPPAPAARRRARRRDATGRVA